MKKGQGLCPWTKLGPNTNPAESDTSKEGGGLRPLDPRRAKHAFA
jgi:hypothetical protein